MMEDDGGPIVFGTPLEPLDADELPSKRPVQLQDQKVYDENGLQRFHGAFTGGFSAGYFNTVGTKEGWAPRTFISSRSQKSDKNVQRPEDFMDAEDLREYGIAPMRVQATEQYRSEKKASSNTTDAGPQIIPGLAPLADIIRPVAESMGVNLLRKLGWRPGQGIGPKRKPRETKSKMYGCALPSSSDFENLDADGTDDDIAHNFLFSPLDITVLPYKPKDNVYGLGYKPLDSSELSSVSAMLADSISGHVGVGRGKKKVAFRGQAFGVGAFEDEDEDIYTKDDLSRYDFVLGGEDKPEQDRQRREKQASVKLAAGGMYLKGFVISSQEISFKKKHFPPPELPKGYTPKSHSKSSTPTSAVETTPSNVGRGRFLNRFAFCAVDRTKMLGSRFQDAGVKPTEPMVKPIIEHRSETVKRDLKVTPTEWANKEAKDVHPAVLKFPTILSTKFVSSSVLDEGETAYGLRRPTSSICVPKPTDQEKPPPVDEQKCQRLIEEWHPASLLCKRFNVPDPFPQTTSVGTLSAMASRPSSQKLSIFRSLFEIPMSTAEATKTEPTELVEHQDEETVEESIEESTEEVVIIRETEWKQQQSTSGTGEIAEEDFKPPTPPTMDLFKAIFEDSASDKDEDDASEQDDATEHPREVQSIKAEDEVSTQPATTPSHPTETQITEDNPSTSKITDNIEQTSSVVSEAAPSQCYGPALPPANASSLTRVAVVVPTKGDVSDSKQSRRGTKRKRSHHKKHKKHKRKKTKYSKSSLEESATDSSSEDDCVVDDSEVNNKLIQRLKELKKKRR